MYKQNKRRQARRLYLQVEEAIGGTREHRGRLGREARGVRCSGTFGRVAERPCPGEDCCRDVISVLILWSYIPISPPEMPEKHQIGNSRCDFRAYTLTWFDPQAASSVLTSVRPPLLGKATAGGAEKVSVRQVVYLRSALRPPW